MSFLAMENGDAQPFLHDPVVVSLPAGQRHGYDGIVIVDRNVNGARQMHAGQLLGQDGDPHAGGYQADLGDGFG